MMKIRARFTRFQKENPKLVFHPDQIHKHFVFLIKKIGYDEFIANKKYKEDRELFIGNLFVYALRELNRREYWLRLGDDPPDIEVVRPEEKYKAIVWPVELTDIPSYKKGVEVDEKMAIEILNEAKLSKPYKLENLELVVYIKSRRAEEIEKVISGSDLVKAQKKFVRIWTIYFNKIDEGGYRYTLRCIKGEGKSITLNLKAVSGKGLKYQGELDKSMKTEEIVVDYTNE